MIPKTSFGDFLLVGDALIGSIHYGAAGFSCEGASARGLPKVGKYAVHVASFETLALSVFECPDLDVLVLDEIGKMELFSKKFLSKTREAFSCSNSRILATIPIPKSPLPLVDELRHHKNCKLIQVSKENRDKLPAEIVEQLLKT